MGSFLLACLTRFERATYRVGVCHSIQLSYGCVFTPLIIAKNFHKVKGEFVTICNSFREKFCDFNRRPSARLHDLAAAPGDDLSRLQMKLLKTDGAVEIALLLCPGQFRAETASPFCGFHSWLLSRSRRSAGPGNSIPQKPGKCNGGRPGKNRRLYRKITKLLYFFRVCATIWA